MSFKISIQDNESVEYEEMVKEDFKRSFKAFGHGKDRFALAFESKQEGKLLTLGAFQDMIEFEQGFFDISAPKSNGEGEETMQNICYKFYDA